jgi:hypothetical protein
MIKSWLAAGVLAFLAGIAREVVGSSSVLASASASNMDHNSIVFYHIAWHVITGLCFLSSFIFIYIGLRPNRLASSQIAWTLNSIFALSAVVVVIVSSVMGWAIDMAAPVIFLTGIAIFGSIGAVRCNEA